MGQPEKKSFLAKIYEDTTRLWHQLVPVDVDSFVERVSDGPESSRTDHVKIEIHKRIENNEPCFAVVYQAVNESDSVMLYASDVFSCHECKEAHLKAEGKIPEKVEDMVWKRAYSSVRDVQQALENAGVPVSVQRPDSRS